ncbi:MAG: RNase A-like domain-containing protein [Clostridium sp.]|uniref:RNase A-like domain-containing protein n=1 Tax=Clostridium TaxID=1485 RepID=UPI001C611074|nr:MULTISPECIES: RNase A-like domain-containing protein [Clostridium]MBW5458712.1 hypothetical protein [Clostridium sporogenes]MDU7252112.1 RNase A-like domain-containing protein [Clostridium sp.]
MDKIVTKIYPRVNGVLDVEVAGYGRIRIKESSILDDVDKICKDRYVKWIEGKSSEGVTQAEEIKSILNGGLDVHESKGGHLLEKHVGKSEQELLERLNNQSKISGSSSFYDKYVAENVCYKILSDDVNKIKIKEWLSDSKKGNKLVLKYNGSDSKLVGIGVKRGENMAKDMYNGKIILKKDGKGGYYILTGYPTK